MIVRNVSISACIIFEVKSGNNCMVTGFKVETFLALFLSSIKSGQMIVINFHTMGNNVWFYIPQLNTC